MDNSRRPIQNSKHLFYKMNLPVAVIGRGRRVVGGRNNRVPVVVVVVVVFRLLAAMMFGRVVSIATVHFRCNQHSNNEY